MMQELHWTNESAPILYVNPIFPAVAAQLDPTGLVGTVLQPSAALPEDTASV